MGLEYLFHVLIRIAFVIIQALLVIVGIIGAFTMPVVAAVFFFFVNTDDNLLIQLFSLGQQLFSLGHKLNWLTLSRDSPSEPRLFKGPSFVFGCPTSIWNFLTFKKSKKSWQVQLSLGIPTISPFSSMMVSKPATLETLLSSHFVPSHVVTFRVRQNAEEEIGTSW